MKSSPARVYLLIILIVFDFAALLRNEKGVYFSSAYIICIYELLIDRVYVM